jgi:nitroreductase|tara:strand:+ start:174 stop:767 length:594 start_codon:yes stop_codon:yes gene_type:complete
MSELNNLDSKTIDFLTTRRSTVARMMDEPGPSDDEMKKIMEAGMRVPDHGRLTPWRFITIRGDARDTIGNVIADAFKKNNPDAIEEQIEIEQERLTRAPVVIAVVSRVQKGHKIPVWEQVLSAGAACQTMLIAAQSMGYAAQWLTEWYAYDDDVKAAIGAEAGDEIAGFVYLGTSTGKLSDRARPEYDEIVSEWSEA